MGAAQSRTHAPAAQSTLPITLVESRAYLKGIGDKPPDFVLEVWVVASHNPYLQNHVSEDCISQSCAWESSIQFLLMRIRCVAHTTNPKSTLPREQR
jgi:hypothetical protein